MKARLDLKRSLTYRERGSEVYRSLRKFTEVYREKPEVYREKPEVYREKPEACR